MEQLITVFSQRLQPQALQRLSVAEILKDASALAIMQEEIPSMDNFRVLKQQKPCFGRMLKFLHMHEPTGYERDEEHKRLAVRYLALRAMLQQCNDIKISSIQEICLDKVLRWFEATETNFTPAIASTPILPPRMSPKKPASRPASGLDKCSSETNVRPSTSTAVSTKLERYKMPDLRSSHIRRIAELRSRGADVSEKGLPVEEDNNDIDLKTQDFLGRWKEEEEKRIVDATFKLYHPETVAEREMNLLWIRRRQEEMHKRRNDAEVQQRVQKWAMDRSRDESENLRKRESTKLVAGLGQMLQEGVNQEKPFAQRSTETLHPNLAGMAAVVPAKLTKEEPVQDKIVSSKLQRRTNSKQPAQIVIKSRKPTNSGGGMHFRNQLPANYVPPGLFAASSVPKTKREVSSASLNLRSSGVKESLNTFGGLDRRTSVASEELSSASENEEEDPASDDSVKWKRRSEAREQMKLQSYHVPYYYSEGADHSIAIKKPAMQKPHPRGTIPAEPLPADPELRCLQEASALRRVFAIQIDKKNNSVELSSSRNSARSQAGNSGRVSKSAKGKKAPKSSRSAAVLPRTAPSYTSLELQFAAPTSNLRQSQMEEMEKIRRLFEENHLALDPQVLERGLLVPEDRPLLETIQNLPFAGSRLLVNPLTRRSKTVKAKKKTGSSKKKKTKKGKKGSKSSK
ncbi:hypothetical protein V7S43_009003 [Phytophthora oleae]|uniref:Uncharacterized protein n=1 Tax=Phytophthora oleae TaxID=2107226 RepID=A0ABD3FHG6_9STRA